LMSRLCSQLSPLLFHVKWLEIRGNPCEEESQNDFATKWLELFRPFTAVQSLRVSMTLVPFVAPMLQELTGERATDVLPALRSLSLGGLELSVAVQGALMPFVAARHLLSYTVTVRQWE